MPLSRLVVTALLLVASVTPAFGQTFVFDLTGSQEVPPVPSTHTGGCHGQLDQAARTFVLTCVHDVVGATVMHVHRAPAGANGDIAFDMGDPASPVTATWTAMTDADISDALAGNLYINIHTAGRPSGEIRGQVLTRTVDLVPFTMDGAQVVPPNASSATGNCTADLNGAATAIDVSCTHNLASADAAHLHAAPFGSDGPIVFTFPSPASPIAASVPLSPLHVANFAARFLYLDVHTPGGTEELPSEEIRGQIGLPPAGATTGTIIIAKETFPAGGTGFSFTDSISAPNAFVLNDGDTRTFNAVAAGTYTVSENDPSGAGYTVADVSCDDANSTEDISSRTATIQVEAGEVVTCTFRNLQTAPTDDLFVFHLSGDQEVPPLTTTERGGCMGRFDSGASELTLVCTHDVIGGTIMHIHRAPAGANGDIVFDLGSPVSPVVATWSGMTPADVADLFAGNLYVNIHTSGRPAGAIRGQIVPRTVDTITFPIDATQVVPAGTSTASGTCRANLDDEADLLVFDQCTHDLPAPDVAHVHDAPRGQNGPVVFTFPSPNSPLGASMPMTPRLVADFAAYFLYLEIHGPDAGEEAAPEVIRGQIAEPVVVPTTGTIRIVKATSPDGGAGFTFTDDVPGSAGTFSLADGDVQTFTGAPAGTYTITENAVAGWSVTDVSCDDDGDSTGDPFARSATVRLQGGESVTCTFTNLQSVAAPTLFVFHLSADQEVPPSGSTARGGCFGQLDTAASSFTLVCTHNVDGPTLAHVHRGAAGVNGPPIFDVGSPFSPIEAVWQGMTPADIADLLAGNLYFNIHASGRPDGEIRGQILPRTVDNFYFPANAAQEVPPTDSTATGDCTADLSANATTLRVDCTHDVSPITMTHLHAAPPGVDGPIVFHFTNTSTFGDDVPLSPRLVADFAAGFLYVNIHSPDYETGEIRGQLIAAAPPAAALNAVPTASGWALLFMAVALATMAWWRTR
jgi:hypothetical protein